MHHERRVSGGGTFFDDLIRLNSNGSPDTVFDVATNFHYPSAFEVYALLPLADGTGDVYVGGSFGTYGSAPVDYLVRMSASGTLR